MNVTRLVGIEIGPGYRVPAKVPSVAGLGAIVGTWVHGRPRDA